MFTLWSDMDRLFNILNDRDYRYAAAQPKFRMNLQDKGDNLEFVAELPGVCDKDINLEIHNDTLTLSAKREVTHDKENTIYLGERGSWNIQRSISLPVAVEVENTNATLKNGILRVTLPKAASSRPQKIAIHA
jgi:HSP20 family protein